MRERKTEQQTADMVRVIQSSAPHVNFDYFYSLWETAVPSFPQGEKPIIAVTDLSVPEIFIRACGAVPFYVPGGFYFTEPCADAFFPPISDPLVRAKASVLAAKELLMPGGIAAVAGTGRTIDGKKTLEWLRGQGYQVLTMEGEALRAREADSFYRDTQMRFLLTLEAVTGKGFTASGLWQEAERITEAHHALQRFETSGCLRLVKSFVGQSYYRTPDRESWVQEVLSLAQKAGTGGEEESGGGLVLMGSPICLPNGKIPGLLWEQGFDQYRDFCGSPVLPDYTELLRGERKGLPELLEELHRIHFAWQKSFSCHLPPAEMENASGIVFHLLKGQLGYAYEAERVERRALKQGIPYLAVETDYSDLDGEQVRIRLEGFAELLAGRREKTKGGDGDVL